MIVLLFVYVSCLLCCSIATLAMSDVSLTFNTSVLEPNNCSHSLAKIQPTRIRPLCDQLRALRSEDPICTNYISEMKRDFNYRLKIAIERAAVQYCTGTKSFSRCFQCFNTATEPIWNKYPCTRYKQWKHIPVCMESFPNPNFNWSREVVLGGAHRVKLVSPNSPPYKKCGNTFQRHVRFKAFNVTFPIYMYKHSEDEDKEYTVILSLFMNAFEDNNPKSNETKYPYGVRCEDLYKTSYLKNYYRRLTSWKTIVVPKKIINSFKTLRADMCGNVTGCMSCFNRGDTILFNYTRNENYRISMITDDYNRTSKIYKNCYQKYNVSKEYIAILNKSHYGMDKVDVKLCGDPIRDQYNFLVKHPSSLDTSNMTSKAKVIVDTVAFNVYSYFGYAIRHNGTKACEVIRDGEMLCFFKYTIDMIDRLSKATTEEEEDDDITTFTSSCKMCVYFEDLWDLT